jgi:apolipoprotein D and lipocalin family protein
MRLRKQIRWIAWTLATASASVCADSLPPIKPVAHVDLSRFMGDWYVIAAIPTRFEKTAYNAVETYRLQADGRVATSFRFRKGA